MSEVDSLDELTNDLDIDNLEEPSTITTTMKSSSNYVDIDGILEETSESFFQEEKEFLTSLLPRPTSQSDDDLFNFDSNLHDYVQSEEKRAIEAAISGIPIHLRKKWTDILTSDLEVPEQGLKRSTAYLNWEHDFNSFSIDKSLREMIIKASSKCDLEASVIQDIENQLISSSTNKKKYLKNLLKEYQQVILSDCNYNINKFPHLNAVLNNL